MLPKPFRHLVSVILDNGVAAEVIKLYCRIIVYFNRPFSMIVGTRFIVLLANKKPKKVYEKNYDRRKCVPKVKADFKFETNNSCYKVNKGSKLRIFTVLLLGAV